MTELRHRIDFAKIFARDQVFKLKRAWQVSRGGKNSLTRDPAYNAANPKHFIPLIEKERYMDRTGIFDKMITDTHRHFWDPNDKKYIDFDQPFDMDKALTEYK